MNPDAMRFGLRRHVSVMVWRMHQLSCVGTLVVVDGNVNQYYYIDLIGGNLLELVEQLFNPLTAKLFNFFNFNFKF